MLRLLKLLERRLEMYGYYIVIAICRAYLVNDLVILNGLK